MIFKIILVQQGIDSNMLGLAVVEMKARNHFAIFIRLIVTPCVVPSPTVVDYSRLKRS